MKAVSFQEQQRAAWQFEWNDEQVEQLRTYWDEGHSAAEISRRMGTTKNSIVGKASRLDLPARPSPIIRDPNKPSPTRKPYDVRYPPRKTLPPLRSGNIPPPEPCAPHPDVPAPYGRVEDCRWPMGEPGARGFHFCEAPSLAGRPYCEEHYRIAYFRVRDRREDHAT